MSSQSPVHAVRAALESERLQLVEKLAADGIQAGDTLHRLAILQMALTAVREEIEKHGVQIGGGGEKELA